LHRVTANRAVDRLRRRKRRSEVDLHEELHASDAAEQVTAGAASVAAGSPSTGANTASVAALGLGLDLERAIGELPERTRMVFILHDVEGFKHREIGELMGISDGSSKSQLFRARAKLRERLGHEDGQ
jgi:RNA polymerase sigma-70 factor (ECF subfamily)